MFLTVLASYPLYYRGFEQKGENRDRSVFNTVIHRFCALFAVSPLSMGFYRGSER